MRQVLDTTLRTLHPRFRRPMRHAVRWGHGIAAMLILATCLWWAWHDYNPVVSGAGSPEAGKKAAGTAPMESLPRVVLTPEEQAYLAESGPITVCPDPDWMPFEYMDDKGNFTGIAKDLMGLIEARLGIRFTYVVARDWDEAVAMSKAGEVLILPFLNQTPKREQWLIFTEPLLLDPNVFITREEHPFITNAAQLTDESVVLPSGTSTEERVREDFPNLTIVNVPTENEVFEAVSHRKADLTLRPLIIAAYTIRKEGFFNLKIAGQAPESYGNHLRMGILKSEPMLRDIINRAIATITHEERESIVNRHVNVKIVRPMDYAFVLRIAGVLALLIGISFYWNYRLKKINIALNESERSKSVLLANLPGIAYRCRFDPQWTMEFISEGCLQLTGYRSEDLLHNRVLAYADLISPEEREWIWQTWTHAETEGKAAHMEYRIITADGKTKWVFEQGVFIYDDAHTVRAIEGLIIDITDRRNAEAEREKVVRELRAALAEVKTLRGILPICANCKKIRDDEGYWDQVEHYVSRHTDASFSHGICPDCLNKLYPEFSKADADIEKSDPARPDPAPLPPAEE
ncbi:two component system response regulator [Desulfococcus multivorans]|nr:two component system response regulator [Desulfococcus multivorans]